MGNGAWVMGNGEWGIGNGERIITNYQLPITNYQLPITNSQSPIFDYRYCDKVLVKVVLGTAPTTVSTCRPPLNTNSVGMLRIP